jgi:hypothetical protein
VRVNKIVLAHSEYLKCNDAPHSTYSTLGVSRNTLLLPASPRSASKWFSGVLRDTSASQGSLLLSMHAVTVKRGKVQEAEFTPLLLFATPGR